MHILQPEWIIGLMSGTSVDGIDAALICTDGEVVMARDAHICVPYGKVLAADIHALMRGAGNREAVERAITLAHADAVEQLIAKATIARDAIKLIGFHGQTIRHDPANRITVQLGDGALLAARSGISVVNDFRSADVNAGGQGAPLVPLYHAALARDLPKPLAVVNIGGVANVTWLAGDPCPHPNPLPEGEGVCTIIALDCGTGGALMDDEMRERTGKHYDENGEVAARGRVHQEILARWMAHDFFSLSAPKSLDRNQFSRDAVASLSTEDALATLAAFTVEGIARGLALMPQTPQQLLVTGGGRRNAHLMQTLAKRLNIPVEAVEAVGWNGDMLEAEAFAFLAARSLRGLPLSLPTTTAVPQAVTGGVFYPA